MSVRLEVDGSVAHIIIAAPPLNIYDVEMRDALIDAVALVRDVHEICALVIRPDGPSSGAGADVREFGNADSVVDARRIRWDRDPWLLLSNLEVPTIAVLRGVCYGSALELALHCDLRIAAPDAQLCLPETRLGMIPAAGATQTAAKWIGADATYPIVLTAEKIEIGRASALGLVHAVVDDPDGHAIGVARDLARRSRTTWSAVRIALRAALDLPLEQGLVVERRQAQILRSSTSAG